MLDIVLGGGYGQMALAKQAEDPASPLCRYLTACLPLPNLGLEAPHASLCGVLTWISAQRIDRNLI